MDPPSTVTAPPVEVLFRSAAALAGSNALGVMLTGMGRDGAGAMRAMKDAGAYNVAQDEKETAVVEYVESNASDYMDGNDVTVEVLG